MKIEVVGDIPDIETIAVGRSIRKSSQLQDRNDRGRWRKLKGVAAVQLFDDTIWLAEIHWYEAHGIW